MALPAGSTEVTYTFQAMDGETVVAIFALAARFDQAQVTDMQTVDTALQAGAEAVVASLDTEFPTATVNAHRTYIGTTGSGSYPWPPS